MTVAELIKELETMPPDSAVILESEDIFYPKDVWAKRMEVSELNAWTWVEANEGTGERQAIMLRAV